MSVRTIRTVEGDTLDLVIWRELGEVDGRLEEVLLLNTHLRQLPVVLPVGTEVHLPVAPARGGARRVMDAAPKILRFWS